MRTSGVPLYGLRILAATPEGLIGLAFLLVGLGLAFAGPLVVSADPTAILGTPGSGPNASQVLGTDALGRDVLARLAHGGRDVILIPLAGMLLTFVSFGLLGMLMGYLGGKIDAVGGRVIDVMLGIPPYLGALIVFAGLGSSRALLVVVIVVMFGPRVARVLRTALLTVTNQDYVRSAQARGEGSLYTVVREIGPNIAPVILTEFALRLTYSIMFVTALNFLGLGVDPPTPVWGLMAAENRVVMTLNPWAVLAPALAIATICIGINFITDGVTHQLAGGRREARL